MRSPFATARRSTISTCAVPGSMLRQASSSSASGRSSCGSAEARIATSAIPTQTSCVGRSSSAEGERLEAVGRDAPAGELVVRERIDQIRLAGPEADIRHIGLRRAWRGLGMRVEDGELKALVLEEPDLRVELERVAVRRRCRVTTGDVALGDAVAQDDDAARLVRRLRARVRG